VTVLGVCGLGSIGRRHARLLAEIEGVRVVGYDPVTATPSERGDRPATVGSFEELLRVGLDGLVVASPDRFHAEATVAACRAGIPVLVEKPLAGSTGDAASIAAVARETGVPVLVGYVLRSFRCMRRARDLLADGAIGRPVSFQAMLGAYQTLAVARNRFAESTAGGLYLDYSHEWDYLRWLLAPVVGGFALSQEAGDLPLSRDPNVVDAVLRLATGVTGTAHLDYVQDRPRRSISIVGDRGTLDLDVPSGWVALSRPGSDDIVEDLSEPRDDGFRSQAQHFLELIADPTGQRPRADVVDGMAAIAVAEALQRSAASRTWQDV